jgi:hypothetical protein
MKKGKYITYQILLACLSKPVTVKKENSAEVKDVFSNKTMLAADRKTKSFDGRKAA